MKFNKKLKIIIILLICSLVNNMNLVSVDAESVNEPKQIDLLLEENTNIQEITDEIKRINPHIQMTKCDEIFLLHLKLPEYVSQDDIVNAKNIKEHIEEAGTMPNLEVVKEDLGSTKYYNNAVIGETEGYSKEDISDVDFFYSKGWHVDEVTQNKKSLDISKGKNVKIALIDSGVDYNHPVLADSIDLTNAKSFVDGDSSVTDTNGHGTVVAGILKQIAPEAKITPYRVMNSSSGESTWTINAIIQAVNDGNDIINTSLGTYKSKDDKSDKLIIKAYERAAKYARKHNVLFIASAGNLGLDLEKYYSEQHLKHLPSNIKGVNAVSSVIGDKLTSYSNYGKNIQFCAPGGDLIYVDQMVDLRYWIYCIYPTNLDNGLSQLGVPQGYSLSFGTSLSAPMVSAGAADILSHYRKVKPDKIIKVHDIEKALSKGSLDLGEKGKDIFYGNGKINIYNSLNYLNKKYIKNK